MQAGEQLLKFEDVKLDAGVEWLQDYHNTELIKSLREQPDRLQRLK